MSDDLIVGGPPSGWCPECDGPSRCAPGTCCGVGAPEAARELHRHLDELQIHARRLGFCCYAAALDPNGPCPWHAEAAQPQAPITTEDVRAAVDDWNHLAPAEQQVWKCEHATPLAAFVADYLNRRRQR